MIKSLLTSAAAVAISFGASADSNFFGDGEFVFSSGWDYSYSEDVMTDTVTHYAAISSLTQPEYSWESSLEIVYTCTDMGSMKSATVVFAQKNSFFSIDNTTPARIRVSDQDMRSIPDVRIPDNNNDYLYIGSSESVHNFVLDMVLSERRDNLGSFHIQFPDFLNGQPHMFLLSGAEDAINRVRRECGLNEFGRPGPQEGIY